MWKVLHSRLRKFSKVDVRPTHGCAHMVVTSIGPGIQSLFSSSRRIPSACEYSWQDFRAQ